MLSNGTGIGFRWSLACFCFGRLREYGMACGVWVIWVVWVVWVERDAQVVLEGIKDQDGCDGA
jgi:hypothetical protein